MKRLVFFQQHDTHTHQINIELNGIICKYMREALHELYGWENPPYPNATYIIMKLHQLTPHFHTNTHTHTLAH